MVDDLLSQRARIGLGLLGQNHGGIRGKVAMRGIAGRFDRDIAAGVSAGSTPSSSRALRTASIRARKPREVSAFQPWRAPSLSAQKSQDAMAARHLPRGVVAQLRFGQLETDEQFERGRCTAARTAGSASGSSAASGSPASRLRVICSRISAGKRHRRGSYSRGGTACLARSAPSANCSVTEPTAWSRPAIPPRSTVEK